jgi:hypothetical protein
MHRVLITKHEHNTKQLQVVQYSAGDAAVDSEQPFTSIKRQTQDVVEFETLAQKWYRFVTGDTGGGAAAFDP